jgi:mannose-6-phosphate isomerase-like protein (cupin superfamily)
MLRRGGVDENTVAGVRAAVGVGIDQIVGARLVADLYIGPGGHLTGEHTHHGIRERFTVIRGRVGFSLGGKRSIAERGTAIEVPPGLAYDWWNAGDDEAHVLVEIAPAAGSLHMRELDGLAHAPQPSRMLQVLLFSTLAPIARLLGYQGS